MLFLFQGGGSVSGLVSFTGIAGSWTENLRLHTPSNSNWTTIAFCGKDNTGDSGTSALTWSFHNYNNNASNNTFSNFYLAKNGSSLDADNAFGNENNRWTIKGSDPGDNNPILTVKSNKISTAQWTYGLATIMPNLTAGHNIYCPIGVGYGTCQSIGLVYKYAGSGSTSNKMGLEVYGKGCGWTVLGNLNMGVGTESPDYKLHVVGSGCYTGDLRLTGANGTNASRATLNLVTAADQPNDLYFGSGGNQHWSITSRGSGDEYFIGLYNAMTQNWVAKTYKNDEMQFHKPVYFQDIVHGNNSRGFVVQSHASGPWHEGIRILPTTTGSGYAVLALCSDNNSTPNNIFSMVMNTNGTAYLEVKNGSNQKVVNMPYVNGTMAVVSNYTNGTLTIN